MAKTKAKGFDSTRAASQQKLRPIEQPEISADQPEISADPPEQDCPADQPEPSQPEISQGYAHAVLGQVSVEVLRATYETHIDEADRMLAYTREQCEKGKSEWAKYFKLRGLMQHVPAKVTQLLALLEYPDLFTEYWVEIDDPTGARVWCYVYKSREDFEWETDAGGAFLLGSRGERIPGGGYLARDAKACASGRDGNHLEKAITGARQRALKQLGLGTAAGIAALEDVQEAEAAEKRPAGATVAPASPEPVQRAPEPVAQEPGRPTEKREAVHSSNDEAERFMAWQKAKAEKLEKARTAFGAYLEKRSKVVHLEEAERRFGPVDKMTIDDMKRAHTEMEQCRSRAKWLAHIDAQAPAEVATAWRGWPGGDKREQALGFLQSVHDALADDATEARQWMLETIASVSQMDDSLDLLPMAQQIDSLMAERLALVADHVDLMEVQP